MPRKPHTKSRSGCVECKRRHIKCDEHRPHCVNCNTASLQCIFLTGEQAKPASTTARPSTSTPTLDGSSTSPPKSDRSSGASQRKLPPLPPPGTEQVLNLDHIELIHHFSTVTYATLTPEPDQQRLWQSNTVKIGLSFPFLLHQILAIAALHLAHCDRSRQQYFSILATELQSQALNGFNVVQNEVNASNCGAVLFFSALLALHVLADLNRSTTLNFSDYLDHLLGCMSLLRGSRRLVMADWSEYLRESELRPMFDVEQPKKPYQIPDECRDLLNLTRNPDLSDTSIRAYESAIERLHFTFALSGVPSQRHSTIRWLLAWPLQLDDDYLQLLNERRPEALIILAYFAVLLHYYRENWAVGDSGLFLFRAIQAHTGRHWERWLDWPKRLVEPSYDELR